MCGIMGYTGPRQAMSLVLDGLARLEYRGYDSSGIAILGPGGVQVEKCEGRLARLVERLRGEQLPGTLGLGHTRWATHGAPSDANAHPHQDCAGDLALVHNGIIENYLEIKADLLDQGHIFSSETDTEVAAHLVEHHLRGAAPGSEALAQAVRVAIGDLRGAYALAVAWTGAPDTIVAARQDSPLVIGLGDGENYLASDIPALLPHTQRVLIMENGELAVLRPEGVTVFNADGQPRKVQPIELDMEPEVAELAGYRHFMEKEIAEQPDAIAAAMRGRLSIDPAGRLLPEIAPLADRIRMARHVYAVACGTAYHAGLIGGHIIERLAGVPVLCEVASEFRYRRPLIGPSDLCLTISQSGETSDTLGALREAQRLGAASIGVVNVVGSSVAREADEVLYTRAGPEIAVASTKAYTTQIVVLSLLAMEMARMRGRLDDDTTREILADVAKLPGQAAQALRTSPIVEEYAQQMVDHRDAFFVGRGLDFAVCLEGQLKLKEISYLHAEAYPAGELKHGTLALIEDGVPVVAVITQPDLAEKSINNVREVLARGGDVTIVAREDLVELVRPHANRVWPIPATRDWLQPVLAAIPLQLLAYHVARIRGCDVDKPRNLAKSVTVE